eukprot:5093627-Pleurochrysis_carterae.AAC.1
MSPIDRRRTNGFATARHETQHKVISLYESCIPLQRTDRDEQAQNQIATEQICKFGAALTNGLSVKAYWSKMSWHVHRAGIGHVESKAAAFGRFVACKEHLAR